MRRDVLLVLIVITALALVGVGINEFWHRDGKGHFRQALFVGKSSDLGGGPALPIRPETNDESLPVRVPDLRLFLEREEYAAWYRKNRSEPDIDARSPESVDFSAQKVVVVLWGDKPGLGHDVKVTNVEHRPQETVVTIETRTPELIDHSALVYPGLSIAVPRGRPVRVLVKGERLRRVSKFLDFRAMQTMDLTVEVVGDEPGIKQP